RTRNCAERAVVPEPLGRDVSRETPGGSPALHLVTVILRWPRSGPRRMIGPGRRPSRLASLAPQGDGLAASLPSTKIPEDHLEHIFHSPPPRETPKRPRRQAQLFGDQLLGFRSQRTLKRFQRLLQGNTVTLARHDGCLCHPKEGSSKVRDRNHQPVQALA